MVISENLSGYIKAFVPDLSDKLEQIEIFGHDNRVPIIKKDAQSVLSFALNISNPKKVLEVGTAIGFSSLLMCEICNTIENIDTLEKDENRIIIARENIEKCGKTDTIKVYEGDADVLLKQFAQQGRRYDFVFLDAAKAQYLEYLKSINKLIKSGGILLTDNVLQEGSVCASKFSVTRRDRTIHIRMREYIDYIMKSEMYSSVIIPVGDGMILSVRKGNNNE